MTGSLDSDPLSREQLAEFIARHAPRLSEALMDWLPRGKNPHSARLNEAVRYAVFPGGKRIRPLLTLLSVRTFAGDIEQGMPVACAVEYFHCSSIVFDDLPAMDDESMRRGREALHRVYGDGLAILAALALFNQGYVLMRRAAEGIRQRELLLGLLDEVALCIGPDGMIGGQAIDLEISLGCKGERDPSRYPKTSSLMRLACSAGAMLSGASPAEVSAVFRFGESLGVAFQVHDDFVDGEDLDQLPGEGEHAGISPVGDELRSLRRDQKSLQRTLNLLVREKQELAERLEKRDTSLLFQFVDSIFASFSSSECAISQSP